MRRFKPKLGVGQQWSPDLHQLFWSSPRFGGAGIPGPQHFTGHVDQKAIVNDRTWRQQQIQRVYAELRLARLQGHQNPLQFQSRCFLQKAQSSFIPKLGIFWPRTLLRRGPHLARWDKNRRKQWRAEANRLGRFGLVGKWGWAAASDLHLKQRRAKSWRCRGTCWN